MLGAVVDTEVSRFFSALAVRMGEATDLEDVLVAGMTEAATRVTGHPALGYLLGREPELVLSQLAFARMDEVLAVTCTFTTPFLGRWLDQAESKRVAESAGAHRRFLSAVPCRRCGPHRRHPCAASGPPVRPARHPGAGVPPGHVDTAPTTAVAAGGRTKRSLQSNRSVPITKGEAS